MNDRQSDAHLSALLAARQAVQASADERLSTTVPEVLEAEIRRVRRRQAGKVEVIPVLATDAALDANRRRNAVARGDQVYLPWRDKGSVPLPNVLLRSSLFGVSQPDSGLECRQQRIASRKDASLLVSGKTLGDHDLQVWAACLSFYRNRPLGSDDVDWVETTYGVFSRAMQQTPGSNVFRGIRDSFERLSAVRLGVSDGALSVEELALLGKPEPSELERSTVPLAAHLLRFRIPDEVAVLYRRNSWSAMDFSLLTGCSGLARWLVAFYCTHSKPLPVGVDELRRLCGTQTERNGFKVQLKRALDKLQGEHVPNAGRVARYVFSEDGTKVTVYMKGWS